MLKTEILMAIANIRQGALNYLSNIIDTDRLFYLQIGTRERIDACNELIPLINKNRLSHYTRELSSQIGLDGLYCDNCQSLTLDKSSFLVDNLSICEECFDNFAHQCEHCNSLTLNEQFCDDCKDKLVECDRCCSNTFETDIVDGLEVCENCYNKSNECLSCGNPTFHDNMLCDDCSNMVLCDCCDNWTDEDNCFVTHSDETICEDCYFNYYGRCESCNLLFHVDCLYHCNNGSFCDSCHEVYNEPVEDINYYKDLPDYEDQFKGPGKSFNFGIEIEMNRFDSSVNLPYGWGVHKDCTTGSEKEIVSPILTLDILRNNSDIDDFFESIKDFPVSTKESLHIHVGNFIDYAHAMNFTALAVESSHIWHTKLCSSSRQDNTYCNFRDSNNFETVIMNNNISRINVSGDRYVDVNTNAWSKHRTIEIRAHQATMNKRKILLWAELWEAFWEYSKTHASFPHICKSIIDMCEMLDLASDEYLERSLVLGRIYEYREPVKPSIKIKKEGTSNIYSCLEDWSVENWSRNVKRNYQSAFTDLSPVEWFKLNARTAYDMRELYEICSDIFEKMDNQEEVEFNWHGLPLNLKFDKYVDSHGKYARARKFKLEVR